MKRTDPKFHIYTVPLTENEKRHIKRVAKMQGRSVSAVANDAITQFVERREGRAGTSISLPLQLHLLGQLHAKQQGISFSAYVESLIERDNAKLNGKPPKL